MYSEVKTQYCNFLKISKNTMNFFQNDKDSRGGGNHWFFCKK